MLQLKYCVQIHTDHDGQHITGVVVPIFIFFSKAKDIKPKLVHVIDLLGS